MDVGLTSPSSISLSPTSGRIPQSSSAHKQSPSEGVAATPLRLADVQLECAVQLGFEPETALLVGGGTAGARDAEARAAFRPQRPEAAEGFSCCWKKRRQPARPVTLGRIAPPRGTSTAPAIQYRATGPRDTPDAVDKRYLLRKEVGRGAYGKVYLATDTVGGMDVAIKVVDGVFNSTTDAKRTLREMSILRQCDHKNVAKCHTVLQPASSSRRNFNHIWLVLELAATDLGALIKKTALRPAWSQRHVQLIIYQALQGLQYMHRANSASLYIRHNTRRRLLCQTASSTHLARSQCDCVSARPCSHLRRCLGLACRCPGLAWPVQSSTVTSSRRISSSRMSSR
jgi:hypothetical protein